MKLIQKKLLLVLILVFIVLFISAPLFAEYFPGKRWRTSKPERQGMDSGKLEQINKYVKENLEYTSSVVVVRNGYIVFEEYFKSDMDELHFIFSITKSITATLIGIAIEQGIIEDIEQKVIKYFPEFDTENLNPHVRDVTIKHLLCMTSGFGEDIMAMGTDTEIGMQKKLLNSSHLAEPGSRFEYNTGCSNLLSMIFTKASNIALEDFGREQLFTPLGISNFEWENLDGYTRGGVGLFMTSRDMAKIGYLYLHEGQWKRKQVVPQEWVRESTQPKVRMPSQWAYSPGRWDMPHVWEYGYQWWVLPDNKYNCYQAVGAMGSCICVLPDLDMVIVITAGDDPRFSMTTRYMPIIDDYVIPAVIE
jgi:CubicO group peptidase (beta-lactamase class C family)